MALIVEVEGNPGSGPLTVVSTHLEDRSTPVCREQQMAALLSALRDTSGPLVLGGDLNTNGGDGTPTSVRREVMKRVRDRQFWASQALHWLSPVAIPRLLLWPLNFWKNLRDPSALHIPLLAPNAERKLFKSLKEFRFADGGAFDFGGNSRRSGNGRGRTLANTNDRAWKGFHMTYRFERSFWSFGEFKLDWLLVKPEPPGDAYRPLNPRTLRALNQANPGRFSDHNPILVDLQTPEDRFFSRAVK